MRKHNNNLKALLLTGCLAITSLTGGVAGGVASTEPIPVAAQTIIQTKKIGTVTESKLTMRSSASTKGKAVTTLKKNAKVTIVKKQNSSWYKVKYGSKTGYVSAKYLKITTQTIETTQYGTVTASKLTMRSSASRKGKVITTLKKNAKVTIVKKQNSSWYKVKYGSKTGYVSAKYLKITTKTTTTSKNSSSSTSNSSSSNSSTVTGMDFLELGKKLPSMGFDMNGAYVIDDGIEGGLIVGFVKTDAKGAYFTIQSKNEQFFAAVKKCFKLLLPTQGNELYNIVTSKNVTTKTLTMDGRKVKINAYEGGGVVDIDIVKK